MKKSRACLLMILIIPFITAMGGVTGGKGAPDKVPVPDRPFSGVFVDQIDIVTKCTDISIEGKTFVEGKKGEGTYTVDFQNIKSVIFLSVGSDIVGRFQMKDDSATELTLKGDSRAYGRTAYGTFQIKLMNLKKMTLAPREP